MVGGVGRIETGSTGKAAGARKVFWQFTGRRRALLSMTGDLPVAAPPLIEWPEWPAVPNTRNYCCGGR